MSNGSTLACCGASTADQAAVVLCSKPCEFAKLDCNNIISILIQSILNLGGTQGSTATEIWAETDNVCPDHIVTQEQVDEALAYGARRGIFVRVYSSPTSTPTFMINALMTQSNYVNKKYNRYPCMRDSFWKFNL